jgi:hypothetical protein
MACTPFKTSDGIRGILCGTRERKKKMPVPDTLSELQDAGYVYRTSGTCRACPAPIAWFVTPNGKWQPFSRKPGSEEPKRFEPHHAVCPGREQFRTKKI